MNEGITHTHPAEKPAKNRQEGHSMLTTKAIDIYGMAGKVGREWIAPHGFVMESAPAPRINLDWVTYLISNLLQSIDQEDTYTVGSAATTAGELITIEIAS